MSIDAVDCKICGFVGKNKTSLATHLKLRHGLSWPDYYHQHVEAQSCSHPECSSVPRYDKAKKAFQPYCVEHASYARTVASKRISDEGNSFGGNAGWKKGLTKEDHPGIMAQSLAITGKENNPFYQMSEEKQKEAIEKAQETKRTTTEEKFEVYKEQILKDSNIRVLTSYEQYDGYNLYLDFKCESCEYTFRRRLSNMLVSSGQCPSCAPRGVSIGESEVCDFLSSLGIDSIERNNRDLIAPRELDIVLPDHKIAIEYNGLYFHTEKFREPEYHKEKTEACAAIGYRLIHIFSDEWEDKRPIVESMLRHAVGKTERRLSARKCFVRELRTNANYSDFFEKNHISGNATASHAFALYHEDEMVACLSLRVPPRAPDSFEIARFATLKNHVVSGGFSRLLKRAIEYSRAENKKNIVTYSHIANGTGNIYDSSGFEFVKETDIDYWYTDGKIREHRLRYRAKDGKSEREIAQELGVHRIYGCGSRSYCLPLQ